MSFLNILIAWILIGFVLFLFWLMKPNDAIQTVVLLITALFIGWQSYLTYHSINISPAVDIYVVYDKEKEGTLLQFINNSKIPIDVWVSMDLEINGNKIDNDLKKELIDDRFINNENQKKFYLGGAESAKTTNSAFLKKITSNYKNESIKIIIRMEMSVKSNKLSRHEILKKEYTFENKKQEWIESTWGVADKLITLKEKESDK